MPGARLSQGHQAGEFLSAKWGQAPTSQAGCHLDQHSQLYPWFFKGVKKKTQKSILGESPD